MQIENDTQVDISVVAPVFNEEDNLETLTNEIVAAISPLKRSFEILYVDDKSTDGSLAVMRRLKQNTPQIRILRHGINSGESASSLTGMAKARGKVIITIDADLQNDPADIPLLLEHLNEEVAAVCGVRRKREDDWVKRISSKTANAFRNTVTGDRIADAGCTYRAIRRDALRDIPVFNGLHRFLPTLLRLQGFHVVEVLVNHRPRIAGVSKYGVGNRAWRGIVDCLAMRWFRKRSVSALRFEGED